MSALGAVVSETGWGIGGFVYQAPLLVAPISPPQAAAAHGQTMRQIMSYVDHRTASMELWGSIR
jgi:hypothetical protein